LNQKGKVVNRVINLFITLNVYQTVI